MFSRHLAACLTLMLTMTAARAMTLASPDIRDGAAIAKTYIYTRCGGGNASPALSWSAAPKGTRSFAVTVIDLSVKPSAWSHWIVVNLPAGTTSLARGVSALPAGAQMVQSNFGEARYDGPCPPEGSGVHRYQFKVLALRSAAPSLAPDEHASSVMSKLRDAALDSASIVAVYG